MAISQTNPPVKGCPADADDFIKQMRGWMAGQSQWPEMDQYSTWLGAARQTTKTALTGTATYQQLTLPFKTWLSDDEDAMDAALA